jgi:hypothetical protein
MLPLPTGPDQQLVRLLLLELTLVWYARKFCSLTITSISSMAVTPVFYD